MLPGAAKAQSVSTDAIIFGKLRLGVDQRPAYQSSEGWRGSCMTPDLRAYCLWVCGDRRL